MNAKPTSTVGIQTGLLQPELENSLLEAIRRSGDEDPLEPIIVLLGSRYLRQYLSNRISESLEASFNIRLFTFADLARDLNQWVRIQDERPVLPESAEDLIITDAVNHLTEDHYFKAVADRPGFIRALSSSLQDIDHSALQFADLANRIRPDVQGKWRTLSQIYQEYRRRLSTYRSKLDEEYLPDDAGQLFRKMYGCHQLRIYGFYDFTPTQLQTIKTLAKSINLDIYMPCWLPADDYGSAFTYARPAYEALKELSSGEPSELLPACGCAFKGFGWRLFRYNPDESNRSFFPSGRAVQIFRGKGLNDEIKGIVCHLNELILSKGRRFDQAGILLWHPDRYLRPLRTALHKAGFPFCDMIGDRLSETTAGRSLISLLAMVGREIKRQDLFDFVATYPLKIETIKADIDANQNAPDLAEWEILSLKLNIISGNKADWKKEFDNAEAHFEEQAPVDMADTDDAPTSQLTLFRRFTEILFQHFEIISASSSFSDLSQGIIAFAADILPSSPELDMILDVISETSELEIVSPSTSLEEYVELLKSVLGRVKTNRGKYGSGIAIMDKMTARGLAFDILFIPGLNQGAVPVRPVEDLILRDNERALLRRISGKESELVLPAKKRQREEERLLFAMSVDAARQNLFLSFTEFDAERGAAVFPSRFLFEFCRGLLGRSLEGSSLEKLPFFEDLSDENASAVKTKDYLNSITSKEQFLESWINQHVKANQSHLAFDRLLNRPDRPFHRCRQVRSQRLSTGKFTIWDGLADSSEAASMAASTAAEMEFPVTGLENYAKCPFRYLMQNVFRIGPLEEPELTIEIPPYVSGSIIHRVLEKLFDMAKHAPGEPLANRDVNFFRDALPDLLKNEIIRAMYDYPSLRISWELTEKFLNTRLLKFVEKELQYPDGFEYEASEQKVNAKLVFPAFLDGFSIRISGRIDRIDKSKDGRSIKIIDYKTGNVDNKPAELKGGRSLQLPLYLKALTEKFSGLDKASCSAEYLRIDQQGNTQRYGISASLLGAKDQELGEILYTITNGISRGLFLPAPSDDCKRCPVADTCDPLSRRKYELRHYDINNQRLDGIREMQS